MKKFSLFFSVFYILTIVGLFLYSYTQVDLSLTLSRISLWQVVEKAFQYVGYFQRPLSTALYSILLVALFISYSGLLVLLYKKILSRKAVWILIVISAVLLTFSYNAFSYDLFNYIFYAKIITHYFQNPYLHRPFDFHTDPMLSFMHWTDVTYPYGPIWLLVTVPVSFIGLQIFLPTFFLFKTLASISYVVIVWCIEKILKKTQPEVALVGVGIFAFSPLVVIEGLISAHNDMVMIAFASLALVAFVNKKSIWTFLLLFLSIGIKFATAVLLPLWIIGTFIKKKGDIEKLAVVSIILLIIPVVLASMRTNFQPWYMLFLFPFIALLPKRFEIVVAYSIFSFFSLIQYIPFLYTGNWDKPIPSILSVMLWSGIVLSLVVGGIVGFFHLVAKRK